MQYLPFLYGAYGSNLNKAQMRIRCKTAEPVGMMLLPDYRLTFRGVADIERSKGDEVALGLWNITQKDLEHLDVYEGFPHLYRREHVVIHNGLPVMVYIMQGQEDVYPPTQHYLSTIRDGFGDFELDNKLLVQAVKRSYTLETPYTPQSKAI